MTCNYKHTDLHTQGEHVQTYTHKQTHTNTRIANETCTYTCKKASSKPADPVALDALHSTLLPEAATASSDIQIYLYLLLCIAECCTLHSTLVTCRASPRGSLAEPCRHAVHAQFALLPRGRCVGCAHSGIIAAGL
jgi:hypothetical protein